MLPNISISTVLAWQSAASSGDIDRLLELSAPDILLAGPRGGGSGHDMLREWMKRAGLSIESRRIFGRDDVVVAEQHAIWRSPESGEIVGEREIASRFVVRDGQVAEFARYDSLVHALADAGLTEENIAGEQEPGE